MSDDFTKESWTDLFRVIGLDDPTMHRWHAAFEGRHPDDHQRFLEWLRVSAADIERIRASSQGDWAKL